MVSDDPERLGDVGIVLCLAQTVEIVAAIRVGVDHGQEGGERLYDRLVVTGCRVLLVDSRPERRSLMRMVVETGDTGGIVVAQAGTAASAVTALRAHSPDAAVVEIGMPVVEGLAAVSAMRAEDASLTIVVCSFHSDHSAQLAARDAGADTGLPPV